MKLKTAITAINIYREDDNPIFGESVTTVRLDDNAAGLFISISQNHDEIQPGEVNLDPNEIPLVLNAAKKLLKQFNK